MKKLYWVVSLGGIEQKRGEARTVFFSLARSFSSLISSDQPQDEDQAHNHVLRGAPLLELDVELGGKGGFLGGELLLELLLLLLELEEPEGARGLEGNLEVFLRGNERERERERETERERERDRERERERERRERVLVEVEEKENKRVRKREGAEEKEKKRGGPL